jgi:signal transduction histidine kinase
VNAMRDLLAEKQVVDFLLHDHQYAYAITDRALVVIQCGGDPGIYPNDYDTYVGCSLYEIAPELVGAEGELAAILQDSLPSFRVKLVNRLNAAGQLTYVNLINLPYRAADQQISGILHVVEDITLLGEAEQSLVQQRNELTLLTDKLAERNVELAVVNTELRQTDEVKSRFISVAAHELRNPLASIMGYLELLLEEGAEPLSEDQRQCVEVIGRSSQRLLSITNNLLDITRIEAGRIELVLQRVNIINLVENVATELQPRLNSKKQMLILDAASELPMVLIDEGRSTQILNNVLNNAIKYTGEKGKITIKLAITPDQEFVQLSVTDNGIGIPKADHDKIFRSFFRSSNVHLAGETGTGLGLSITRSLVELQGGQIWFESELGKGSTFYLTFPIDDNETVGA